MSEISKHLFEAYTVGSDGRENFRGNAFTVLDKNGKRKLVTAAHVAELSEDGRMVFRSLQTGELIKQVDFTRRALADVAEANIEGSTGLISGGDVEEGSGLNIISSLWRGRIKTEKGLTVARVNDGEIHYVGADESQISSPGSSGSPILTPDGKVVAVHTGGTWLRGIKRGIGDRFK